MRIPANLRTKFLKEAIKNGMKELTYDIETSHSLLRMFPTSGQVWLRHEQIKVPGKVISIQYKWGHEKKAKYLVWDKVSDEHGDVRDFDDSAMIEEFITTVLDQADLLVTQNGDKFDFQILNERAKATKLSTLTIKPSIDILKLSRKSFRAASHKLDYRSQQQGLGGKIQMCDQDWIDIEENGVSAEKKMIPYGLKDVLDTDKIKWRELEYYKDLPIAVEKVILSYLEKPKDVNRLRCTKCNSLNTVKKGIRLNKAGKYQEYTCKDCGTWFKGAS